MIVGRRWSVPSPQNPPALCPHRLCQRSIGTDAVKLPRFARDCVRIIRCVHNLPDGTIGSTVVSPVPEGTMSRRSSLEAIWAEIHDFTEGANTRTKIRTNRRSVLLTLPITLFLANHHLVGWLALV